MHRGHPQCCRQSRQLVVRPTCVNSSSGLPSRPKSPVTEIHFCQHKTCSKQGAKQIFQLAQDLGLSGVKMETTGCLGACGAGPNMVLLPEGTILRHVTTPAHLESVLRQFAHLPVPADAVLATQLRLAGNTLAYAGDLKGALAKYKQALEVAPHLGVHRIYSNMSSAFAQLGDKEASLHAAQQAVAESPNDFAMAWVRLVDAYFALQQYDEAADACRRAFQVNPEFKGLKDFKAAMQALQRVGRRVA